MSYPWRFLPVVLASFLTPAASAHFKLLEPVSWISENQLGDPQKAAPCGGTSADPGTPTNTVTKAQGGHPLHLKWIETVYHPGHYRISLAVNSRSELPADPVVQTRPSEKGPTSVSAAIQQPARAPVLIDGLFPHTTRQTVPWETDILLPNISCDHCTLQIIQFMAEHGLNRDGDYSYHHCADLQITADPSLPAADPAWRRTPK